MTIAEVLPHRAARCQLGSGPQVLIRTPMRLTSWEKKVLAWGDKNMKDKNIKLVNVIQVMLVRRILPCQQQDFNLWEFDPAQHQTLSGLFDTTYEDAWRVLFKGAEAPASATEDRGFSTQCSAGEVSHLILYGILAFHVLTLCGI